MREAWPATLAWIFVFPARARVFTLPELPARNVATGPGVVLTSAIRALQCPVAWSPLLTGSSLAAWLSAAPWPSGMARTTRPSAISSRRITRRKSAGRARSTRGRFEPPDEARDRGGLSVSARAEVGTARPRHRVIGTVRLLQSARACCTLGEAMTDQATCRDTHREDRRPRWPDTST